MAGPIGIGRAVIMGNMLWALGPLFVPFAGLVPMPLPILVAGQILAGMGATIYTINQNQPTTAPDTGGFARQSDRRPALSDV